MSNNNIDAINYKGIVSLKVIDYKSKRLKKQATIHNNGSDTLFYFLCNCLAKNYSEDYAPLAIDAFANTYSNTSNEDALQSALAYRVLLSSQNVIKDLKIKLDDTIITTYSYAVKFSTIIPYALIINSEKNIKCLQLHAKLSQADKLNSLLAWVNIDGGIEVKDGEALLVEWNMGFANPISTQ